MFFVKTLTKFKINPNDCPSILIDRKPYRVFLPITRFSCVVFDEAGQMWQYVEVPAYFKEKLHSFGSMVCQPLCQHELKRFHLSCFKCIERRVWLGKMPKLFRLENPYTVFAWADRPRRNVKNILRKALCSIIETLSV